MYFSVFIPHIVYYIHYNKGYMKQLTVGFFGNIREFKQIATAGATTAAVTEKVWGEYVAAVCQILAK